MMLLCIRSYQPYRCPLPSELTCNEESRKYRHCNGKAEIERIGRIQYNIHTQDHPVRQKLLGTSARELEISSAQDEPKTNTTGEHTLVTDFVPSEMACFDSSPGRMRRTAVWISREEIVDFLEYDASSASLHTSVIGTIV